MIILQRPKSPMRSNAPTLVFVNGQPVGSDYEGLALKLNLKKGDQIRLVQSLINRSKNYTIIQTNARYTIQPNRHGILLMTLMILAMFLLPQTLQRFIDFSQNTISIIIFGIFMLLQLGLTYRQGLELRRIA